jgi:RNA polymerase sigma-70 factor (ECF subfamily)
MPERNGLAGQRALDREVVDLYRQHGSELLRWALSLAPDADAARDAVQETFLRYFVERRYGRSIEKPRSWLYVVTRNYLSRHGALTAPEVPSEKLDRVPGEGSDPEQMAQRSELARQVFAALTKRETTCLQLRAEGRGYAEIARLMRIRPGTVGALLAHAQSKVRIVVAPTSASPAKRRPPGRQATAPASC